MILDQVSLLLLLPCIQNNAQPCTKHDNGKGNDSTYLLEPQAQATPFIFTQIRCLVSAADERQWLWFIKTF